MQAFYRPWNCNHDLDGLPFIYLGRGTKCLRVFLLLWNALRAVWTSECLTWKVFFCTIFLPTLALPYLEWFVLISSFPLYAALLFEWDSHCLLLWHCHVSLHMAQYLRKLTCHHQVCISTRFSARNLLLLTFMNSSLLYIIATISWVSSFQVKQLEEEEWAYSS
jgi:hypothetical protein